MSTIMLLIANRCVWNAPLEHNFKNGVGFLQRLLRFEIFFFLNFHKNLLWSQCICTYDTILPPSPPNPLKKIDNLIIFEIVLATQVTILKNQKKFGSL